MKYLLLIAPIFLTGCLKMDTLELDGVGQWVSVRDNDIEGPNMIALYYRSLVGHDAEGNPLYTELEPVAKGQGPGIGAALAGAAGQIFRDSTRNADDINNTTVVNSSNSNTSSQEQEVDD